MNPNKSGHSGATRHGNTVASNPENVLNGMQIFKTFPLNLEGKLNVNKSEYWIFLHTNPNPK